MSISLLLNQFPVALIFLIPGVALILGAHKIAQYNRKIREAGLKSAEQEAEHPQKLTLAKIFLWKESAEAGGHDELVMVLIGMGVIAMGFFVLLHPNGW